MRLAETMKSECSSQKNRILSTHFANIQTKISHRKHKGDQSSLRNASEYYNKIKDTLNIEYIQIHEKMMNEGIYSTHLHYIFNPIANRHKLSLYRREATRDNDVIILAGCEHYSVWKNIENLKIQKTDNSRIGVTEEQKKANKEFKIEVTPEIENDIKGLWEENQESVANYFIEKYKEIYQIFTYEYESEIYIVPLTCNKDQKNSQKKYFSKCPIIITREDQNILSDDEKSPKTADELVICPPPIDEYESGTNLILLDNMTFNDCESFLLGSDEISSLDDFEPINYF